MKNKDIVLEERNKIKTSSKKIVILLGMIAVFIAILCGYLFKVKGTESYTFDYSLGNNDGNYKIADFVYGYSDKQRKKYVLSEFEGKYISLVEDTLSRNIDDIQILEQPGVYCVQHGQNLTEGEYKVGQEYTVTDDVLAFILAAGPTTGLEKYHKNGAEIALWKYLYEQQTNANKSADVSAIINELGTLNNVTDNDKKIFDNDKFPNKCSSIYTEFKFGDNKQFSYDFSGNEQYYFDNINKKINNNIELGDKIKASAEWYANNTHGEKDNFRVIIKYRILYSTGSQQRLLVVTSREIRTTEINNNVTIEKYVADVSSFNEDNSLKNLDVSNIISNRRSSKLYSRTNTYGYNERFAIGEDTKKNNPVLIGESSGTNNVRFYIHINNENKVRITNTSNYKYYKSGTVTITDTLYKKDKQIDNWQNIDVETELFIYDGNQYKKKNERLTTTTTNNNNNKTFSFSFNNNEVLAILVIDIDIDTDIDIDIDTDIDITGNKGDVFKNTVTVDDKTSSDFIEIVDDAIYIEKYIADDAIYIEKYIADVASFNTGNVLKTINNDKEDTNVISSRRNENKFSLNNCNGYERYNQSIGFKEENPVLVNDDDTIRYYIHIHSSGNVNHTFNIEDYLTVDNTNLIPNTDYTIKSLKYCEYDKKYTELKEVTYSVDNEKIMINNLNIEQNVTNFILVVDIQLKGNYSGNYVIKNTVNITRGTITYTDSDYVILNNKDNNFTIKKWIENVASKIPDPTNSNIDDILSTDYKGRKNDSIETKYDNPKEIEIGDTVRYYISVSNITYKKKHKITIKDCIFEDDDKIDLSSGDYEISVKGIFKKKHENTVIRENEGVNEQLLGDGISVFLSCDNEPNSTSDYYDCVIVVVDVKINKSLSTDTIIKNTAYLEYLDGTKKEDSDCAIIQGYDLSIEKYVSKVTDKDGNNIRNYSIREGKMQYYVEYDFDENGLCEENDAGYLSSYYNGVLDNEKIKNNIRKNGDLNEDGSINFSDTTYYLQLFETENNNLNINCYKRESPISIEPGDKVTYTIKITNNGTTSATVAQINDYLPANGNINNDIIYISNLIINGESNTLTITEQEYLLNDNDDYILNLTQLSDNSINPSSTVSFDVTVQYNCNIKDTILENKAEIVQIKNRNNIVVNDATFDNVDFDYVQIVGYDVSIEKYISKVNEQSTTGRTNKQEYLKPYDFDENGTFDSGDPNYIMQYYNGTLENGIIKENVKKNGDANNDGVINAVDYTIVMNLYAFYPSYIDTLWKYNNVVEVSNGDKVTYTIKVTNKGQTSVKVSQITDYLPNGIRYNNVEYKNNIYNQKTQNAVQLSNLSNILIEPGGNSSFEITVDVIENNISLNIMKNVAEITKLQNRNDIDVDDADLYNNTDADYFQMKDITISGMVWNDKALTKAGEYNGIRDDTENVLSGVKVFLCRGNSKISSTTTNNNGEYTFSNNIKGPKVSNTNRWEGSYYSYIIKFQYDGIIYTSTNYTPVILNNVVNNSEIDSNAKEEDGSRESCNNLFTRVNKNSKKISYGTVNEEDCIPQSIYNFVNHVTSSTEQINLFNDSTLENKLKHINLGLRGRDIFDLELTQKVEKINVTINGINGEYNYSTQNNTVTINNKIEDMANILKETKDEQTNYNVSKNQNIRNTDVNYCGNASVIYKITVQNTSKTKGTATQIIDYFDTNYNFEKAYYLKDNVECELKNTNVEEKGKYRSVIVNTQQVALNQEETMDIYIKFSINNLNFNNTNTFYNLAEIYEYKTECGDGQTEFTRGVIDKDSKPGSANIEKARLKNNKTTKSTTVEYYFNKANLSILKYEDDTSTLAVKFNVVDSNLRTITGTVFEDLTTIDTTTNIKTGDGIKSENEVGVYGATVELIEQTTNTTYSTTTDENGVFTISGYIPGNYIIRYWYGDTDKTFLIKQNGDVNLKSYNGENYQSTNNTGTYNSGKLNETLNYWYLVNEIEGISTATENSERRQSISNYVCGKESENKYNTEKSKQILNLLNNVMKGNSVEETLKNEVINNTKMFADTPNMSLGVEKYIVVDNTVVQSGDYGAYEVSNMNFGISEIPVTKLNLTKEIVSFTIKDSSGKSTLAEMKYDENGNRQINGNILVGNNGLISVNIKSEELQGSKLKIEYKIKQNTIIENDFSTGENNGTTQIISLYDYIPNNLSYNPNLNSNSNKWNIVDNNSQLIVEAKQENKIFSENEDTIVLEQVLSSYDDTLESISSIINTFVNTVEIMGIDYTGVKYLDRVRTADGYIIIPGVEHDKATSETIIIYPPTGYTGIPQNYYLISIISLGILSIGIYAIKKYVLDRF